MRERGEREGGGGGRTEGWTDRGRDGGKERARERERGGGGEGMEGRR